MGSRCNVQRKFDFIQLPSFIKIKSANLSYFKKPSAYKLMGVHSRPSENHLIPAFKKVTVSTNVIRSSSLLSYQLFLVTLKCYILSPKL